MFCKRQIVTVCTLNIHIKAINHRPKMSQKCLKFTNSSTSTPLSQFSSPLTCGPPALYPEFFILEAALPATALWGEQPVKSRRVDGALPKICIFSLHRACVAFFYVNTVHRRHLLLSTARI